VSFSPDGRLLATGSFDSSARVWDALAGEPVSPPLRHQDTVFVAAFSPDGNGLLTASWDKNARIWPLPPNASSARDLELAAQLLTGSRIDATGGRVPLEPESLLALWRELRTRTPSLFDLPQSQIQEWHRQQAERSEEARQWSAAKFHLDYLLVTQPVDAELIRRSQAVTAHLVNLGQRY
jgi:WD40 repeat protein